MKKTQKRKRFNPILMPINSSFMNISNTDCNSLSFIKRFDQLLNLDATNTFISDLKGVQISESMLHIQLEGTPFSKNEYYRLMVLIGLSPLIKTIDRNEITPCERELAHTIQEATLLLIYQGYLICNLEPLTLFINLDDNNDRTKPNDNAKTIVIPPEKIVINTKMSLPQIKTLQTFAMIEDLSNEIQKTANDWKIQPIKKNEIGDLLNQIKKVHKTKNTQKKSIQKKRNLNQTTNDLSKIDTVVENDADSKYIVDPQVYSALVQKFLSNDTTEILNVHEVEQPKKSEDLPKSPKFSKSELAHLFRQKRKQNSMISQNDDQSALDISAKKDDLSNSRIVDNKPGKNAGVDETKSLIDIKSNNKSEMENTFLDKNATLNDISNIDLKNENPNAKKKNKVKVVVKKKRKKVIKVSQKNKNKTKFDDVQTISKSQENDVNDDDNETHIDANEIDDDDQNEQVDKLDDNNVKQIDKTSNADDKQSVNKIDNSINVEDDQNESFNEDDDKIDNNNNKNDKNSIIDDKQNNSFKEEDDKIDEDKINSQMDEINNINKSIIDNENDDTNVQEEDQSTEKQFNKTEIISKENLVNDLNESIVTESDIMPKIVIKDKNTIIVQQKEENALNEKSNQSKEMNFQNDIPLSADLRSKVEKDDLDKNANVIKNDQILKEEKTKKYDENDLVKDASKRIKKIKQKLNKKKEEKRKLIEKEEELNKFNDANILQKEKESKNKNEPNYPNSEKTNNEKFEETKEINVKPKLPQKNNDQIKIANQEKEVVNDRRDSLDKNKKINSLDDKSNNDKNFDNKTNQFEAAPINRNSVEMNQEEDEEFKKIKEMAEEIAIKLYKKTKAQNKNKLLNEKESANNKNDGMIYNDDEIESIEKTIQENIDQILQENNQINSDDSDDQQIIKETAEEDKYEEEINSSNGEIDVNQNQPLDEVNNNNNSDAEIDQNEDERKHLNIDKKPVNITDETTVSNIQKDKEFDNKEFEEDNFERKENNINLEEDKEQETNNINSNEKENLDEERIQTQKSDDIQSKEIEIKQNENKDPKKIKKIEKKKKKSKKVNEDENNDNNESLKIQQNDKIQKNEEDKRNEIDANKEEIIQNEKEESEDDRNKINKEVNQKSSAIILNENQQNDRSKEIENISNKDNKELNNQEDEKTNVHQTRDKINSDEEEEIEEERNQNENAAESFSTENHQVENNKTENNMDENKESNNIESNTVTPKKAKSKSNEKEKVSQKNLTPSNELSLGDSIINNLNFDDQNSLINKETLPKKESLDFSLNEDQSEILKPNKKIGRSANISTTPTQNRYRPINGITDDDVKRMVWEKPLTPVVSIMKRKATPPQDKRSVKFSFSATSDNDLNANNFFSNDDDSFSDEDESQSMSFPVEIQNVSASAESIEDAQYTSKIKQKIAKIRKKAKQKKDSPKENQSESVNESHFDPDEIKENKDFYSNDIQEDDENYIPEKKIETKVKEINVSNNFFVNDDEEDLTEAELEYRLWIQQQNKESLTKAIDPIKEQENSEDDMSDEEFEQIQNKYSSILSQFESESSSELPPEYSAAYTSLSKDLFSFSKDSGVADIKNKSIEQQPSTPNKLSEKLSQQLKSREEQELKANNSKNEEFDHEADGPSSSNKQNETMSIAFSPNNSEINAENNKNDSISSGSETSPNRKQLVLDKIKAIKESNRKKKQEDEKKKLNERMKMLNDSLESLSKSESKNENDDENENENIIDKIRESAYQRAKRIQDGNSILSSSFGFHNVSSSFASPNFSSPPDSDQLENLSSPTDSASPILSQNTPKSSIGTNRSDTSKLELLSADNQNNSDENEHIEKEEKQSEIKNSIAEDINPTEKALENKKKTDFENEKKPSIPNKEQSINEQKINNSQIKNSNKEVENNSNLSQPSKKKKEKESSKNISTPKKFDSEKDKNLNNSRIKKSPEESTNSKPRFLSPERNKPNNTIAIPKRSLSEKDKSNSPAQSKKFSSPGKEKNNNIVQPRKLYIDSLKEKNPSTPQSSKKSLEKDKSNKNTQEKEINSKPKKSPTKNISKSKIPSPVKGKNSRAINQSPDKEDKRNQKLIQKDNKIRLLNDAKNLNKNEEKTANIERNRSVSPATRSINKIDKSKFERSPSLPMKDGGKNDINSVTGKINRKRSLIPKRVYSKPSVMNQKEEERKMSAEKEKKQMNKEIEKSDISKANQKTALLSKKTIKMSNNSDNDSNFDMNENLPPIDLYKNNFSFNNGDFGSILDDTSESEENLSHSPRLSAHNDQVQNEEGDDDSSVINLSISEALKEVSSHQNIPKDQADSESSEINDFNNNQPALFTIKDFKSFQEKNAKENAFNKQISSPKQTKNEPEKIKTKNESKLNGKEVKSNEKQKSENSHKQIEANLPKIDDEIASNKQSSNSKKTNENAPPKKTVKKTKNKNSEKGVNKSTPKKDERSQQMNNFQNNENKVTGSAKQQIYNRSYFFLTEDSGQESPFRIMSQENTDEKQKVSSADSSRINNVVFDSEENGQFLLRFSLLNEEEEENGEEVEEAQPFNVPISKARSDSIKAKIRKIKKKKLSNKKPKAKNEANDDNIENEELKNGSPKSKVKYQGSLAQILQLKPKVPATMIQKSFSSVNSTNNNIDEPAKIAKSGSNVSNDVSKAKKAKSENVSNDSQKADFVSVIANNQINQSQQISKDQSNEGKRDIIYPLIDKENLIPDILHMPSESAQIDEFLELEEIAKLDSNLVSSSAETQQLLSNVKSSSMPYQNQFANENQKTKSETNEYSPIRPLQADESELIGQFSIIQSESENSPTAFNRMKRQQRRNRKRENENNEKNSGIYVDDEEMMTYLSENDDDSGENNFPINNNLNQETNENNLNSQFHYNSDSDSISEVFKTSPKNQTKNQQGII